MTISEARAAFKEGSIDRERLTDVEDTAVLEALERQRQIGIDVYSDGEFRRTGFQWDFPESVEGYVSTDRPVVSRMWQGPGGPPQEQGTSLAVGGKLRPVRRLTEQQAAFLRAHAPGPYKMTVPSANQFPTLGFQPGLTDRFYPTRSDLLREVTAIIKSEVAALADEGVPYIQIDAPRYKLQRRPEMAPTPTGPRRRPGYAVRGGCRRGRRVHRRGRERGSHDGAPRLPR